MELEERVRILTQCIHKNNDTDAKMMKRIWELEREVRELKKAKYSGEE